MVNSNAAQDVEAAHLLSQASLSDSDSTANLITSQPPALVVVDCSSGVCRLRPVPDAVPAWSWECIVAEIK